MGNEVRTPESAVEIAESYADEECVGTFGEVIDVTHEGSVWVVEFRTHAFSGEFTHRIGITDSVGNVISHDRNRESD